MKPIETARLLLRPYTTEDLDAIHSILSDKRTMRFWSEPFSMEKTALRIERSMLSYDSTGFGKFAIIEKESGRLIGDCGITLIEVDGKTENNLGYIIHHDFHGRRYATEAAKACVIYAFDKLHLRRLTANMATDNKASIRVAEKIGMRREKLFPDERNHNRATYLYSVTAPRNPISD